MKLQDIIPAAKPIALKNVDHVLAGIDQEKMAIMVGQCIPEAAATPDKTRTAITTAMQSAAHEVTAEIQKFSKKNMAWYERPAYLFTSLIYRLSSIAGDKVLTGKMAAYMLHHSFRLQALQFSRPAPDRNDKVVSAIELGLASYFSGVITCLREQSTEESRRVAEHTATGLSQQIDPIDSIVKLAVHRGRRSMQGTFAALQNIPR